MRSRLTLALALVFAACSSDAGGDDTDAPDASPDSAADDVGSDTGPDAETTPDTDTDTDAQVDTEPPPDPVYWSDELTEVLDDIDWVYGPEGEQIFALGLSTGHGGAWDGVSGPNECDRETGVGFVGDARDMGREASAAGANFFYIWSYRDTWTDFSDFPTRPYGRFHAGWGVDRPREQDVIPVIYNGFGERDMGEEGREERVAEMEAGFADWAAREGQFSPENMPNLPPYDELPWMSWHPTWRMTSGAETEGQEGLTDAMAERFAQATNMMIGDSYTYVVNRFESILNEFTGQRGEVDEGYEDWLDWDDPDHHSYFTAAWDIVYRTRRWAREGTVSWQWMQGYGFDTTIGREMCEDGNSDAWAKGPFPSWAYLRKEITSTIVAGGTGIIFFGYMKNLPEDRDVMNRIFRSLSSEEVYGPALLSPRLALEEDVLFTGEDGRAHVIAKWDEASQTAYLIIANPGAHVTEVAIEFPWSLRSAELLDWSETVFADDEIVTTRHRTVHVAMPRDDGAIVRVHPLFAP